MNRILASSGALAFALSLVACAGPAAPRTAVMGAGPACDVSIAVGSEAGCMVAHVSPPQDEILLTNGMRVHGSTPMTP